MDVASDVVSGELVVAVEETSLFDDGAVVPPLLVLLGVEVADVEVLVDVLDVVAVLAAVVVVFDAEVWSPVVVLPSSVLDTEASLVSGSLTLPFEQAATPVIRSSTSDHGRARH